MAITINMSVMIIMMIKRITDEKWSKMTTNHQREKSINIAPKILTELSKLEKLDIFHKSCKNYQVNLNLK